MLQKAVPEQDRQRHSHLVSMGAGILEEFGEGPIVEFRRQNAEIRRPQINICRRQSTRSWAKSASQHFCVDLHGFSRHRLVGKVLGVTLKRGLGHLLPIVLP